MIARLNHEGHEGSKHTKNLTRFTQMRLLLSAVLVASMVIALSAQTPRPTYEVASIKKLDQAVTGMVFGFGPAVRNGTLRMTNSTIASLLQFAYGLRDFQVVGGPDWVTKDLFEVQAKAAGDASTPEMRLMLQSLLGDRFGLVVHKEQRDMRFFAMVPMRSDGRLGPYLHKHADGPSCNAKEFEAEEKVRPRPASPSAMAGFSCAPLSTLAELASQMVEIPVFDKTGLTGNWSGRLIYTSPRLQAGAAAPESDLPSFPAALQEQLGLKLEQTRGPVEVTVIDSVRQPTEN